MRRWRCEIEDRLLAEDGGVEIAGVNQQLVLLGLGLGDDLAVGIDDQAAADQRMAVLDAGLGDGHDPGRVLIGAGLQRRAGDGTAASPAPRRSSAN